MTAKNAKDSNNKTESSSLPFEIRERAKDRPPSAEGGREEQHQASRKKRIEAIISSEKLDAVLTAIGSLKLQQHIMIQR